MKKLLILFLSVLLGSMKIQAQNSEIINGEVGQKIDRYMQKVAKNDYNGSVLVAQKGKILLSKGYGLADKENNKAQTSQTVFSIGSITKQFTGAAILKLEMQGKLSVNDLMSKYFDKVPEDKKDITLHHLLTHSAGFRSALGDDYEETGSEGFAQLAFDSKLLFKPGDRYEYSNTGYSLLGIIVEKVSGLGYEQYLYEHIFKPAGMEKTGYLRPQFNKKELAVGYRNGNRWGTALDRPWMTDGPGWHLRANGGILSTVGDMYLWALALKNNKVLSAEAKKKYFDPHIKEYEDGDSYYGYGWVNQKSEDNSTLIWHNGGNGIYNAFMGMDLEKDLTIIVSSNISGKISDDYAQKIYEIIQGKFKEMDEALLKAYSGTYQLPSGVKIRAAFNENNQLITQFEDSESLLLLSGNGEETKEESEKYDQKVKNFLNKALMGDFSALAEAWNEPVEEVKERATPFWENQKKQFGEAKTVEIIGTVKRPKNILTFAKIPFAKKNLYMLYIWEGNALADVREMPLPDKVFEAKSTKEFFAQNNQKTLIFEKDAKGNMTLLIKNKSGDVMAVKIKD